jgi:ribonuclease HI
MWKETSSNLNRKFEFKDFDEAFEFMERVAEIARALNHHPSIINTYNKVELQLMTHSAGNKVTDKDRKFADRVDRILNEKTETTISLKLEKAKLFTDGGSRGNPGPSALGYVILDMSDGEIKKESEYLGITTNNQAEYKALLYGLKDALDHGVKELEVYMDSQLIVNQVNGEYKVKNADLLPIYTSVKDLASRFNKISFTHVPRAMNKIADALVNECLDSQ